MPSLRESLSRDVRWRGAVTAFALLLGSSVSAAVQAGDHWQPLPLTDSQGKHTELVAPPAGVLLVEISASWCSPCREALPALAKLSARYSSRGLQVTVINIDRDHAAAERFLETVLPQRGALTVLFDASGNVSGRLGSPGMPSIFVVVDGRVERIEVGYTPAQYEAIERVVQQHLPELQTER